jgi:hypothetical protein
MSMIFGLTQIYFLAGIAFVACDLAFSDVSKTFIHGRAHAALTVMITIAAWPYLLAEWLTKKSRRK